MNNMKHEHNHATYMNTFHVYVYYEKYANFPEGSSYLQPLRTCKLPVSNGTMPQKSQKYIL